jgi:plastocyanin
MKRPVISAFAAAVLVASTTAAAAYRSGLTISQRDKQFSQAEVRIRVGDTLVFVNNDAVTHNVFSSTEGFRFNLKRQPPGTEAKIPFASAGTAQVRCAFHPTMKLTVRVE